MGASRSETTTTAPGGWLSRGFFALSAVTFVLLVFGATVRVHGAGLSCPDWPLCFGQLIPQLDFSIFLEWGHRALASIVSLGFLVLGVRVLLNPETRSRAGTLVIVAALVLVLQIILGGLTVLHLLVFWSVTLHLLTGNLFLFLIFSIAQALSARPVPTVPSPLRYTGVAVAVAAVAQVTLGALVSSNYAGMACPDWPTCNDDVWFPTFTGIVGLQLVHRLGAYTLFLLSLLHLALSWRHVAWRRSALLVVGLIFTQICVGVANVWLAMPVEFAVLHSAVADTILLTVLVQARQLVLARAQTAPSSSTVLEYV